MLMPGSKSGLALIKGYNSGIVTISEETIKEATATLQKDMRNHSDKKTIEKFISKSIQYPIEQRNSSYLSNVQKQLIFRIYKTHPNV